MAISNVVPMGKREIKAHAEWTLISPAIAEKWLNIPMKNRALSDTKVAEYAAEMKAGKWDQDNGETLKIGPNGQVIDGQHRLWGIIYSEVTLRLLVVFDVSEDSFSTIDRGKTRSIGDAVSIAGVSNANNVSAVATLMMAFLSKKYSLEFKANREFRASERFDWAVYNGTAINNSLRRVSGCGVAKVLTITSAAAIHMWVLSVSKVQGKEVLVDSFFKQLGEGIFDTRFKTESHPVRILREKLLANKASLSGLPTAALIALTVKAWNAYASGKTVTASGLRMTQGEVFPRPI